MCMDCNHGDCDKSFHATCALLCGLWVDPASCTAACPTHAQEEREVRWDALLYGWVGHISTPPPTPTPCMPSAANTSVQVSSRRAGRPQDQREEVGAAAAPGLLLPLA